MIYFCYILIKFILFLNVFISCVMLLIKIIIIVDKKKNYICNFLFFNYCIKFVVDYNNFFDIKDG